jgi:hypothetical protein
MLMVGWKATRLEVIQVIRFVKTKASADEIREVCDKLLDKTIPEKQRSLRAEAILMIGRIFRAAERDPSQAESGDYAFEQLLASSQNKKKRNGKTTEQD